MDFLWTTDELVAAMAGRPMGTMPAGISGISIDSRAVKPGEAFFAIKGDRVDGHDFVTSAAAHGASLLVVSEARLPALGRVAAPLIVVHDVLEALERLGRAARARARGKIIAVTGSVGKTTTKEMLRQVLSASGTVHYSPASFNNHWGVPLTLARLPRNADFGVFEIGMNHPDEIRPLVGMVRPHVAIITTVAAAHLGNFKNIEEIAAAKAEIFEGLTDDGHALINRDIAQFDFLEATAARVGVANIHSFGANVKADYRLVDYQGDNDGAVFWAAIGGRTVEVSIAAPGRHIAENAIAVLAAATLAGADLDATVAAFAEVTAGQGRGQRIRLAIGDGAFTLIDESYNANPASMRAAIALLAGSMPGEGGRRIAVLGDMLEMGEFSADVHAGLAEPLIAAGIDEIWIAGPDMAYLRDALQQAKEPIYRDSADELTAYALANIKPGDVVMVKSSNGSGFGRIVAALKEKFPPA
ncbi:UDP-N-acetylmuramoylalanyl-D-glutamyl-2,6-diaminopimelate--D-alanyl-D-alanine ligase [Rhizobium alvei]|uniref:UDP-N-acetylmuramoyl-tripeptide--D-alanyl-D-alanine ligase n=1 Tax=Rhizobium alvei TaxID=1132659 RepID=A0ABT8YJQ2_9HYPH|nr:UDP-N-acetylmuramoylalanyl-D-glutamyl-2,6-diaminopimelate--D-alanyl-D-alanine ligase [Rhizobium alvei]MDO6963519.1 UDP-N-acetylmuramoylalanyl-D-glutamyl-2,6-diaminopimelate--D-alanyl-D-alanine ligase [Rhizobium alvei]